MQVALVGDADETPLYEERPFLRTLIQEPPGLFACITTLKQRPYHDLPNGEIALEMFGKYVPDSILGAYRDLARMAWQLRSECGRLTWVHNIPAILHVAQITWRWGDKGQAPPVSVFFHRQHRHFALRSPDLFDFLRYEIEIPASLRDLQYTDSYDSLNDQDKQLYMTQVQLDDEAVQLGNEESASKRDELFRQLADPATDWELRATLTDTFSILCLVCRSEDLPLLLRRFESAKETSGVDTPLRYNKGVATAAEQPQSAQLPKLSAGSATTAGSHAATFAVAADPSVAGPSTAQPAVGAALFDMSGLTLFSEVPQSRISTKQKKPQKEAEGDWAL